MLQYYFDVVRMLDFLANCHDITICQTKKSKYLFVILHHFQKKKSRYINRIPFIPFIGHFLASDVIKVVHTQSGVDCILQCTLQDKLCRSVNFRKKSVNNGSGNCELLHHVYSEYPELLYKDKNFDHYKLLLPKRVSINIKNRTQKLWRFEQCKSGIESD